MEITWKTGYCEYANEETQGQVKVTTLHWTCTAIDGEYSASTYGTESVSDQNRVYSLPALQNVPQNVMTQWTHDAMGEEQVATIEAGLAAQIEEQKNPTGGGLTPAE